MKLNREQYVAAHHMDGPMLVLAGPGSGKTHLLVERIRMMIEDRHIPPENILVITFSKKAARQMQARFLRSVEGRSYPVTFGTFHAVFYHILQEYDPHINRLITEDEQRTCLRKAVRACSPGSDLYYYDDFEDTVLGYISSYKNFGVDDFMSKGPGKEMTIREAEDFNEVLNAYNMITEKEHVIDFDDMIIKCREVFYRHESVLRKWQARFKYFLVDEFQDINTAQYDVLRLLAGDAGNVFAVGDDDQSIYAFRGSKPELMKRFSKQYRGCRTIVLSMNYRCGRNIIGASDSLIRHNISRIDRPMQRHIPSKGAGMVEVINTESSDVQAAFVCDMIQSLICENVYEPHEIAVLYRSQYCAGVLKRMAKKRGLPEEINYMTAHASKGLEFLCVFIIGLQEGIFPHHEDITKEGVEEERRLMYVAMTRAVERLYMITVSTGHGKRPSRFVKEAAKKEEYITDRLWARRV